MIHSKDLDPHFKFQIAKEPGGENITKCFSCGTCTAGCPVREITDRYNPRRIIRMVLSPSGSPGKGEADHGHLRSEDAGPPAL